MLSANGFPFTQTDGWWWFCVVWIFEFCGKQIYVFYGPIPIYICMQSATIFDETLSWNYSLPFSSWYGNELLWIHFLLYSYCVICVVDMAKSIAGERERSVRWVHQTETQITAILSQRELSAQVDKCIYVASLQFICNFMFCLQEQIIALFAIAIRRCVNKSVL